MRRPRNHVATALSAIAFVAACDSERVAGPTPSTGFSLSSFIASTTATVSADKDTYLKQGTPNQSQGSELMLRLQASGNNRALLSFSTSQIQLAIGSGALIRATLELTIVDNGNNWGPNGRENDLHRIALPWSEQSATWNCATDLNPINSQPDCSGSDAWSMSGPGIRPWEPVASASAAVATGQNGVVSFDVTDDVQAFRNGTAPNNGWLLKKRDEGAPGRIDFGSRESTAAPRLVLEIDPWLGEWRGVISGNAFILDIWQSAGERLAAMDFDVAGYDRETLNVLGVAPGPPLTLYLFRRRDHATIGIFRDANSNDVLEYWEQGCSRSVSPNHLSIAPSSTEPGTTYSESVTAGDLAGSWSGSISGNSFTIQIGESAGQTHASIRFSGDAEDLVILGLSPGPPRALLLFRPLDHATISVLRDGSGQPILEYWEAGCARSSALTPVL